MKVFILNHVFCDVVLAVSFRVTAKSYKGHSLPSTPSDPIVVGLGSVREITGTIYYTNNGFGANIVSNIPISGTETITCNISTVGPNNFAQWYTNEN